LAFLRQAAAGDVEPLKALVAPGARHHNQYFPAGFDALLAAMAENARQQPRKAFTVHHAVAEGDLVAVHSHLVPEPGQPGMMVLHLFRFAKGKVIELWDMGQPIQPDGPNRDGPF
jgi:predicted SnoaL-like aldol condensation-catalyzing enzyme